MPLLRPRTEFALLLLALCAGPAHAAQAPVLPHQKFTFDAASSEFDYKAHTGSFQHIEIAEGKITVRADRAHATGITEQNGQWTLLGHVHIHAPPHGTLNSDQAVVDVANEHITRVTVTGNPAQFKQQSPTGKITQGHADQIIYDIKAGTVQLNRNAWVNMGRTQFSGPTVLYNIKTERIQATSKGAGKRVHITIAPKSSAPAQDAGAAGQGNHPPQRDTSPRPQTRRSRGQGATSPHAAAGGASTHPPGRSR